MLIEAFALFHKKYSNSQLVLIGDGELKPKIAEQAKEQKIQDSIIFKGVLPSVYNELYNSDIFILPSNYEGIPISIIEAMGTGIPIIATAVGGVSDMIDDGMDGLLIKNDLDEAIEAMEKLYNDLALRMFIGKNALKKVERFASRTMANSYLKIYQSKLK